MDPLFEALLANSIPGMAVLILSVFFIRFPPRKPNLLYGYRTARSMKSQEIWDEGNRYSARLMLIAALISLGAGIAFAFFIPDLLVSGVCAAGFLIVLLFVMIIQTERYLKKNFDDEGRRKNHSLQN